MRDMLSAIAEYPWASLCLSIVVLMAIKAIGDAIKGMRK